VILADSVIAHCDTAIHLGINGDARSLVESSNCKFSFITGLPIVGANSDASRNASTYGNNTASFPASSFTDVIALK
jgi:hypothetical protein